MKKIIKNPKKGAAIELALVTMVVVFSLTTLLLGITLISKTTATNTLNEFEEKTQLAQIAMEYITNNTVKDNDYVITNNGDNTFTITNNKFKLKLSFSFGNTITKWTYTLK